MFFCGGKQKPLQRARPMLDLEAERKKLATDPIITYILPPCQCVACKKERALAQQLAKMNLSDGDSEEGEDNESSSEDEAVKRRVQDSEEEEEE